jgi:hypothetical protein
MGIKHCRTIEERVKEEKSYTSLSASAGRGDEKGVHTRSAASKSSRTLSPAPVVKRDLANDSWERRDIGRRGVGRKKGRECPLINKPTKRVTRAQFLMAFGETPGWGMRPGVITLHEGMRGSGSRRGEGEARGEKLRTGAGVHTDEGVMINSG